MNTKAEFTLLKILLSRNNHLSITVHGESMYPLIRNGDSVEVTPVSVPSVGDILVFGYHNCQLISHRLLFINNQRYYCKGDNAFRLEEICFHQVLGKVTAVNKAPIPSWDQWKIDFSLRINQEFLRNGKDFYKTMSSTIYQQYRNLVLNPLPNQNQTD